MWGLFIFFNFFLSRCFPSLPIVKWVWSTCGRTKGSLARVLSLPERFLGDPASLARDNKIEGNKFSMLISHVNYMPRGSSGILHGPSL